MDQMSDVGETNDVHGMNGRSSVKNNPRQAMPHRMTQSQKQNQKQMNGMTPNSDFSRLPYAPSSQATREGVTFNMMNRDSKSMDGTKGGIHSGQNVNRENQNYSQGEGFGQGQQYNSGPSDYIYGGVVEGQSNEGYLRSLQDQGFVSMPSLIQHYLDNMLYSNVIFLAERFYAECRNEDNLYLLANCYVRCGLHRKAISILESSNSPRNRYVYAHCCFHLGKLGEAETALLEGTPIKDKGPTECRDYILNSMQARDKEKEQATSNRANKGGKNAESADSLAFVSVSDSVSCIPNGAAGLFLLGKICQRAYRRQHAIEYFKLALEIDPYMWCAFEALCKIDMNVDSEDYYGPPIAKTNLRCPTPSEGIPAMTIHDQKTENKAFNASKNKRQEEGFYGFDTPWIKEDCKDFQTPWGNRDYRKKNQHIDYQNHNLQKEDDNDKNNFNVDNIESSTNTNLNSFLAQTPSKKNQLQTSDAQNMNFIINNNNINNNTTTSFEQGMRGNLGNFGNLGKGGTIGSGRDRSHHGDSNLMTPDYVNNSLDGRPQQRGKGSVFDTPGLSPIAPSYEDSVNLGDGTSSKESAHGTFQRGRRMPSTTVTSSSQRGIPSHHYISGSTIPTKPKIPLPKEKEGTVEDGNGVSTKVGGRNNHFCGTPHVNLKLQISSGNYWSSFMHLGSLLATLGKAYELLCKYKCSESIDLLRQNLPLSQYNTGWVQMCVGKAFFEMADYVQARSSLEHMLSIDPQRSYGLDLLSTSLWQLRDDVALAFLAQQVHDRERSTKEGWCVIGNCFSLQKEHETALKFFQRALVLDPYYTYAYTLCGHEYIANENFDKALACFRFAVRIDPYHYNAWYGLGHIYYRQEKYDMAEYHFSRALGINSHNAVLHCSLGMSLHASHRSEEALDRLQTASLLDPKNHVARFNRASVLVSLERHHEALQELEKLRNVVPKEAAIYSLLGKIYKKIGDRRKAIHNFTIAMDLSPKDNNRVKSAMDHLDDSDVEEEKL